MNPLSFDSSPGLNSVDAAAFGDAASANGIMSVPAAAESLFTAGERGAGAPDTRLDDPRQEAGQMASQGDNDFASRNRPSPQQPQGSYPFSDKSADAPETKGTDVAILPQTNELPALMMNTFASIGNASGPNSLLPNVSAGDVDRQYGELTEFNGGFAQRIHPSTSGDTPTTPAAPQAVAGVIAEETAG